MAFTIPDWILEYGYGLLDRVCSGLSTVMRDATLMSCHVILGPCARLYLAIGHSRSVATTSARDQPWLCSCEPRREDEVRKAWFNAQVDPDLHRTGSSRP